MRAILSSEDRKNLLAKCSTEQEFKRIVSNPEYAGKVEGIRKVTLFKNSVAGIQYRTIHKGLMEKYQMLQPSQPAQCLLNIETQSGDVCSITVTGSQSAMLKALVLEQCNLCLEYSKVVATLFWDYVRALIKGGNAATIIYTDAKGSWGELIKKDMIEFMKVKGV